MKAKFIRLSSWAAVLVVLALLGSISGSTPAHAQPSPATVNPASPPQLAQEPAAAPYIICGVCGARIQQPQQILVAAPFYNGQAASGYDCGYRECVPPAPVFSLTDYGRADPRYIRPTLQPVYSVPVGPYGVVRRIR